MRNNRRSREFAGCLCVEIAVVRQGSTRGQARRRKSHQSHWRGLRLEHEQRTCNLPAFLCPHPAFLALCRYDINDGSSDDEPIQGEADTYGRGADGFGASAVSCDVVVPTGGESAFRVTVPSGAQIVVPLPDGTYAGDSVAFELTSGQLDSLPASDITALNEGRFFLKPGRADE